MSRQNTNRNNQRRNDPRDHEEHEEEYQPPKTNKARKPPAKANRDKIRSDNFRVKKGNDFMENVIKKQVEDVLFQGFEDLKQVVEEMTTVVSKNPSALPVTTRSIGFDTYMIYKQYVNSFFSGWRTCN